MWPVHHSIDYTLTHTHRHRHNHTLSLADIRTRAHIPVSRPSIHRRWWRWWSKLTSTTKHRLKSSEYDRIIHIMRRLRCNNYRIAYRLYAIKKKQIIHGSFNILLMSAARVFPTRNYVSHNFACHLLLSNALDVGFSCNDFYALFFYSLVVYKSLTHFVHCFSILYGSTFFSVCMSFECSSKRIVGVDSNTVGPWLNHWICTMHAHSI